MTLVVAWAGFDDKSRHRRKVSSLYIAADSRINWNGVFQYDGCQKVFASVKYPEIFGFCDDVNFCEIVIGQILDEINNGILFRSEEPDKADIIAQEMQQVFSDYPKNVNIANSQIIYGTRICNQFHLFQFQFKGTDVSFSEWPITEERDRNIFACGSGKKKFYDNFIMVNHEKDENHMTTRNVYHCVARTIEQCPDSQVGGVPQMVGLYRGGNGRHFGIVKNDGYYFGGRNCKDVTYLSNVEWRNDNFERVDVRTGKLIKGAHPQPMR